MSKSGRFGTYYGKLSSMSSFIDAGFTLNSNGPQTMEETTDIFDNLSGFRCKNIMVDNVDEGSDTVFFSIDKDTDYNGLLVYLVSLRPNEFSEVSPDNFRIWWD